MEIKFRETTASEKKQLFTGPAKSQMMLVAFAGTNENLLMTAANISTGWTIYPWICLVGEVFIPFKDPPSTLHAGRAPGPSCGSHSLTTHQS